MWVSIFQPLRIPCFAVFFYHATRLSIYLTALRILKISKLLKKSKLNGRFYRLEGMRCLGLGRKIHALWRFNHPGEVFRTIQKKMKSCGGTERSPNLTIHLEQKGPVLCYAGPLL